VPEPWRIVALVADDELRLRRTVRRDGAMPQDVRARMAAQLPDAERRRRAAHVLANDGTLDEPRARVDELLARLAAG
jgi:dephospho-CoA kinase